MSIRVGGFVLLVAFFALERFLRHGDATNLRPAGTDRLSTPLLIAAYVLAGIGLTREHIPGPR